MFEEKDNSNNDYQEQKSSQADQNESGAVYTEHKQEQTAGSGTENESAGSGSSYQSSGTESSHQNSGTAGSYQSTGSSEHYHSAGSAGGYYSGGYQNGAYGNGSYQNTGYQNGGQQNTGYQGGSRQYGSQQSGSYQSGSQQSGSYQSGSQQGGSQQGGSHQGGYQNGTYQTAGTGSQNAGNRQGNFSGYGNYQSYQGSYQYGSGDYGTAAAGGKHKKVKEKKPKKPMKPFWKKAIAVVVSGVCFGVIAGVSFLAVSSLGVSQTAPASAQAAAEGSTAESEQASTSDSGIKSTVTEGTTSAVVTDVTEVVEQVMPSIVSITNQSITSVDSFWGQTFEQEQESAGSGIIIGENDTELLVVTNNHVVEDSTNLYIKFIDDEVVNAYIKGTSPSMDLAVVAIKLADIQQATRDAISIATMGDSDSLKVGEPVIAIGNALGYGQSVTTGVVSALNRTLEVSETGTSNALIQTDAAINPGNSGGALLDIKGQVIGINSNKIGGNAIEGMGYAIPISSAQPIIEELMNQETRDLVDEANRGYLGISCINVTADMANAYGMPEGVYVAQVYTGTGADEAGLVKGDIIVGFAGRTVTTQDDLTNAMQYYAVGDTVEITIMHGNPTDGYEEQTVTVTLTSQEAMNSVNQ